MKVINVNLITQKPNQNTKKDNQVSFGYGVCVLEKTFDNYIALTKNTEKIEQVTALKKHVLRFSDSMLYQLATFQAGREIPEELWPTINVSFETMKGGFAKIVLRNQGDTPSSGYEITRLFADRYGTFARSLDEKLLQGIRVKAKQGADQAIAVMESLKKLVTQEVPIQ